MKRICFTSVLVLGVAATLTSPALMAGDPVLEAVQRLGTAYRDGDVETLESLITDQYVHTNSSSKPIDREAWLGWVANRAKAIDEGRLRVLEYDTSGVTVLRHGDTAIVTGLNRTVREHDGRREESAVRFTMVWVKTDEGWKRAAFQDCRVQH